jgi:hypothetical protein
MTERNTAIAPAVAKLGMRNSKRLLPYHQASLWWVM